MQELMILFRIGVIAELNHFMQELMIDLNLAAQVKIKNLKI